MRLLAQSVLGFWVLHLTYRTTLALLDGKLSDLVDPALDLALAIGFVMSIGFCGLLIGLARRGLAFGLGAAALLSVPFSLAYAAIELTSYYHLSPEVNGGGATRRLADGTVVTVSPSGEVTYHRPGQARATVVKLAPLKERVLAEATHTVASNATGWYFFYFGLGSFFVGMSSAARLRRAELRAAEYERLAHSSQLRALRYQINPHFLFNTLNSLSALIMARRDEQAETMILNLSSFFRTSLAIDPTEDISLREEIALQRLYLDIESARFPSRLRVDVAVPDALMDAKLPALLLQPLVENAIKYGVALSQGLVNIRIRAARAGEGVLELMVENELALGQDASDRAGGTGVGLRNVCERLQARFGSAATCSYGPTGDGAFRVTMLLPLVRG